MTYPSLGKFTTEIPGDHGDVFFNLWVMRWVAHALPLGWTEVWNANIFYPNENALAYSESYLSVAPVFGVLDWAFGPVVGFNLIYIATWWMSLWFMYLLALHFTRNVRASFVAATAFTFSTLRMIQYLHFQLLMGFLVPVILFLLVRVIRERKLLHSGLLGVALAGLTVAAGYYGVMMAGATMIIVVVYLLARRLRPGPGFIPSIFVAAATALVLVLPSGLKYVELQRDPHFARGPERQYSADIPDFLAPVGSVYSRVPAVANLMEELGIEKRLFPGLVAILLGTIGIAGFLGNRRSREKLLGSEDIRLLMAASVAALVFLVLSFGLSAFVAGYEILLPYRLLTGVPGFSSIRAPTRLVLVFQCVLCLFAALGLTYLLSAIRSRAASALIVAGLTAAVLIESWTPIATIPVPSDPRFAEVNEVLATRARGAVLELPITGPRQGNLWNETEGPRQFLSTIDWNPRVNGISALAPPQFELVVDSLNDFPAPNALQFVDFYRIKHVIMRLSPVGHFPPGHRINEPGITFYEEDLARDKIAQIPPDRLVRVDRIGDAYLIELRL